MTKFAFRKAAVCLIAIFTVGFSARAGELPDGALTTELKDKTFSSTLKEGFHFNEKAPNSLNLDGKTIKPDELKGRSAQFKNLPGEWTKGRASLYVCDDALTFCNPMYIDLKGTTGAAAPAPHKKTGAVKVGKHGFIENDFEAALEKLKKSKGKSGLMLVDFSATWCPGCVRLETEVFDTKRFKDLTKDFVKLKIDVDMFESRLHSEKYGISGIPALVVLDSNQEEIGRLVDYQPIQTIEAFLRSVRENPTPLSKLAGAAKDKDPKAAYSLGKRLLIAGRFAESIRYLSLVQPAPPELMAAKVGAAENESNKGPEAKAAYVATLKEAIQQEPSTSRSISWRQSLVGLLEDKAAIEKLRQDGVKLADSLLADPKKMTEATKTDDVGEFAGYEPMLVAMNAAFLVSSSNAEQADIDAAWKKAVDAGKNVTADTFGPALRYLIILTKAKMYAEADKLAASLIEKNPGNAEVKRRRIKILVGLRRFDDAIKTGLDGLKTAFGRNEFWVAEDLAKAYIGAGRKDEAKALIERYLARDEMGWRHMKDEKAGLEKLKSGI